MLQAPRRGTKLSIRGGFEKLLLQPHLLPYSSFVIPQWGHCVIPRTDGIGLWHSGQGNDFSAFFENTPKAVSSWFVINSAGGQELHKLPNKFNSFAFSTACFTLSSS